MKLCNYGVLDRYRPNLEKGSAPEHHVLASMGAIIAGAILGEEPRKILTKEELPALAYHPHMKHLLAINGFFSHLVWACRQTEGTVLTDWQGEARTRQRWARIVRPDSYGRIEGPQTSRRFFLEMDMGTETLDRLRTKLLGYDVAATSEAAPDSVLFCFPTPRREAGARKALRNCGLTVATTYMDLHEQTPLGPIWLPLGSERRCCILEVPA